MALIRDNDKSAYKSPRVCKNVCDNMPKAILWVVVAVVTLWLFEIHTIPVKGKVKP